MTIRRMSTNAVSTKNFNVRNVPNPAILLYSIAVSPSINGSSLIDLTTGNLTISTAGVWTITPCSTFTINVAMWGAGGQNAFSSPAGTSGAGGYSFGTLTLYSGNTYTVRVGANNGGGAAGSPGGISGKGGGYSGVFSGTETFANSAVIAGGGGGGCVYYNLASTGGGGGGSSGGGGTGTPTNIGAGGGTQSAGGAGGYNTVYPVTSAGSAGGQLTGGVGANSDGNNQPGAGGGSGYYGGGGGRSRLAGDGLAGTGGGGSGYLHPVLVSNGNTEAAVTGTAGNSASSLRGTSGNPDANGIIVLQRLI